MSELELACERILEWLTNRLLESASGVRDEQLDVVPRGKFWLGR